MTIVRLQADERLEKIKEAVLEVAASGDYRMMTRGMVAKKLKCTPPLLNHYVGEVSDLRELAVQLAIEKKCLPVLGQAMAARHPAVRSLDVKTQLLAAAAYLGLPPLKTA